MACSKQLRILQLIILAAALLTTCVSCGNNPTDNKDRINITTDISQEIKVKDTASEPVTDPPKITEAESAELISEDTELTSQVSAEALLEESDIPIDFKALKSVNPDIYAWINIPDTPIDFPILQSPTSDSFYLRHDINGKYDIAGSIYTESLNSTDFTDFNTMIYGHNMTTGVMFEPLMNYLDREYFDENRYITVYTPDKILTYKIFAAFVWDDRHILYTYDFSKEYIRDGFIKYVFSIRDISSAIDTEMQVTSDDKIITLSTCTYKEGERLLVMGVLCDDE